MTRSVPAVLIAVASALLSANDVGMTWAGTLPQEPGEERLVAEDVNVVSGFYIREYSLHGNGTVDYRTARQILRWAYDAHWNTVVDTVEFPLFYWYDEDQDGHFRMWVDRKVEGCVCDIVPYTASH